MIDDKRQRALSSQIGHDLPRDLTLIAREVIAADNIDPADQCLSAFATLVLSCGKDFGIRLSRWRGRWGKPEARISERCYGAASNRNKHRSANSARARSGDTAAEGAIGQVAGDRLMARPDLSTAPASHLAVAPPAVAQHQSADWGLVQAEQVDIIRHEPFSYEFKGPRHLLVASERAERYDGETHVDGLPRSNRRAWSRRMSFIPAGHRFYGWQKPRALTRSTFLYIDPLSPLLGSELRFTEVEFKPRLFFFDLDIWETALKLKAQLQNSCRSQKAYVEALGIALAHELTRMNEDTPLLASDTRGGLPHGSVTCRNTIGTLRVARCKGSTAGLPDDVRRESDQFRRVATIAVGIACTPAEVDPHVAAVGPAQLLQRLQECCISGLCFRIVRGQI